MLIFFYDAVSYNADDLESINVNYFPDNKPNRNMMKKRYKAFVVSHHLVERIYDMLIYFDFLKIVLKANIY